jgi:hypothetical protein
MFNDYAAAAVAAIEAIDIRQYSKGYSSRRNSKELRKSTYLCVSVYIVSIQT